MRRGYVKVRIWWWSRVMMTGAERGMEILRRLRPVDIHERTAQWRHEGWTGYDANAITSTPTSSAATTARSSQEQNVRHHTCEGQGSAHTTRRGPRRGRDSCGARRHHHRQTGSRAWPTRASTAVSPSNRPKKRCAWREEKVTVERRPADRPATDADFAAAAKEVIEITETAEEAGGHQAGAGGRRSGRT